MSEDERSPFGEVIFSYTRAQAIADGVLIEVPEETSKEAGFRWSVALTTAVYSRYVEFPEELSGEQNVSGRLWDILWMTRCAVAAVRPEDVSRDSRLPVQLHVLLTAKRRPPEGGWLPNENESELSVRHRLVTLHAHAGPGDDGQPVMTIMLPDED